MSPIPSSETSASRCCGISSGSASTLHLVRDLREDAALADADRVADQRHRDGGLDRLVEPDFLQVDVDDRAADLVALEVLEDRRVRRAAVDLHVEHGVRAGARAERGAKLALADRDRDRVGATVEDARNQPLLAQATRLRRPQQGPLEDGDLDTLSSHGEPVYRRDDRRPPLEPTSHNWHGHVTPSRIASTASGAGGGSPEKHSPGTRRAARAARRDRFRTGNRSRALLLAGAATSCASTRRRSARRSGSSSSPGTCRAASGSGTSRSAPSS